MGLFFLKFLKGFQKLPPWYEYFSFLQETNSPRIGVKLASMILKWKHTYTYSWH
jgi:hypothetical protein